MERARPSPIRIPVQQAHDGISEMLQHPGSCHGHEDGSFYGVSNVYGGSADGHTRSYSHSHLLSSTSFVPSSQSPPALSPRAALVAGLRSATDRRQKVRDRDRALGALSPAYTNPNSPWQPPSPSPSMSSNSTYPAKSPSHHQQQHQQQYFTKSANVISASPSHGQKIQDHGHTQTYAQLYAKQQELVATSLLIQQQQQRISAAMDTVMLGDNYSGRRPSSPSIPPRPQSSFSFRSRLFPEITSRTPTAAGPNTKSPIPTTNCTPDTTDPTSPYNMYNQQSAGAYNSYSNNNSLYNADGTGSPQSFKKRHRKSSSMGMAALHNSYNGNLDRSQAQQQSNGYSYVYGSRSPRSVNYEIPIRQPHGPPPVEELTKPNNVNFASRI